MGDLGKAHRLLSPRVAYLIGSRGADGQGNLIPVSNVTSISTDPQQVVVAVLKRWATHENLRHAEGFNLSVPSVEQAQGVWKLGARYSRFSFPSAEAKLHDCGLDISEAAGYGPVLRGGLGWMACRILQHVDSGGNHGVFVAQVERVEFDESYFSPDGSLARQPDPLMQVTGNVFTTSGQSFALDYGAP
jgi:flavin reductase (DIM6/NTAB) family NADH-FMN oxidoreductase RutF